jgi:hypothetical protein
MYVYIATVQLSSGTEVKIDIVARNWSEAVSKIGSQNVTNMKREAHKVVR